MLSSASKLTIRAILRGGTTSARCAAVFTTTTTTTTTTTRLSSACLTLPAMHKSSFTRAGTRISAEDSLRIKHLEYRNQPTPTLPSGAATTSSSQAQGLPTTTAATTTAAGAAAGAVCHTPIAFPKNESQAARTNRDDAPTSNFKGFSASFPCMEKEAERRAAGGPEPMYDRVVSGYEVYHHKTPFQLYHGGVLPEFNIAYETWGTLNASKSNAILLHTGLSASSHAKSQAKNTNPGWWEAFIGPGCAIDTNKFFVMCTNVLGSCYGSTGPSCINPTTGEAYATHFPILTVQDMVRAQFHLLDHMGIQKLYASVGSSLGGMQSLTAAALHPSRVGKVVSISAAAMSHPLSIAMRHVQRRVLMADPHWNGGQYYKGIFPHFGMKVAREIGTISYRSGPEWEERFGRQRANPESSPNFCPDFLIETYLDHQGELFCLKYDPNSLLYISKAMDLFDLGQGFESLDAAFHRIDMPALVLGVESDILFPEWQQRQVANKLRTTGNQSVVYYQLDSIYGHDTFLIDVNSVGKAVKGHLENE
ncbi:homoserine O-acetyltransferase [Capsaspora owczarzaki ATCC 30864]|uniref:Homoserine O-acetyltransferase n=1 Tax=Capsaspora owczarzaki (strain ATCC 30864) TaxID=595528 RepID=A0A0D2X306_CAPO3|nr:homoserine O-acetyltransferase [Capsaspora owczarzaki ATCC 30864]KJE93474.1 homoserine O-acetyltransferase [Capsaspora owczarzaki ATCC 30864]|eukprot:XP_004348086.2 homoserine O-acetyltransferase [Capsaspora owczarzaki ATCC 30864]